MEVPIIPETGINEVVLEEIKNYVALLIEQSMRYGNSIPMSTRAEYAEKIAQDFQEWYKNHPEVHTIECVQQAVIFCGPYQEPQKAISVPH